MTCLGLVADVFVPLFVCFWPHLSLWEGNGNPLQYSCLEKPMEEPGRLQSMGSQRVGHDWAASLSAYGILVLQAGIKPRPSTVKA